MIIEKTMPSGVRVVAERIPHFHSVTVAFYVRAGAVTEGRGQSGMSHFVEHMVFKGTNKRSSVEISQALDGVGGQLNAFTAKECTCFYARVMREHLALAMDVISDMLLDAKLDMGEMEKEKGVVLEEIRMVEDTPDDVVHELINDDFFAGHPLAKPILGTARSVKAFTSEKLREYIRRFYGANNLVVSIAGDFDPQQLDALCDRLLAAWPKAGKTRPAGVHETGPAGQVVVRKKSVEQVHLCLGYPGLKLGDEDAHALLVLNNILGGSMSSRLFQRIREERGLAYSVYSYPSFYATGGLMTLYAGCAPDRALEVARLMKQEVASIADFTQDEFQRAWQQMRGNWALGQESTNARASSMGKALLLLGRVLSDDEVFARMQSVTPDQVRAVIDKCMKASPHAALVGRVCPQDDVIKFLQQE
nr:pitrilysin family protein [bacterium]